MSRKKLFATLALSFLTLSLLGAAATKQITQSRSQAAIPGFVSLAGEAIEDQSGMLVEMAYDVEAFPEFDSITVETQPSGRMLSAHVMSSTPDVDARLESPVARKFAQSASVTSSQAREGRARVAVPYEVFDDKIVEVRLWSEDESTLLSRAHVETIAEFSFTSTFLRKEPRRVSRAAEQSEDLAATQLAITHCCSGGHVPCDQMCTECQGPTFFCNLIVCEIECGPGPY